MALYDRDYYRDSGPRSMALGMRSMVFYLIVANVAVYLLQLAFMGSRYALEPLFACSPADVFEHGRVWQLLTANFLHKTNLFHLAFNMFWLYFFGREMEEIYGKVNFLIFFLLAGVVAVFTEASVNRLGEQEVRILGASGAVMGVTVLFAFFFPRRQLLIFGVVPMEVRWFCLLVVIMDVSGLASGSTGVAHFAHLAGAGVGVLYRFVDLRWETIRRRFSGAVRPRRRPLPGDELVRMRSAGRPRGEVLELPRVEERRALPAERDPISARIDELLDKIHKEGKESLTEEELDFLRENSQRYRSE